MFNIIVLGIVSFLTDISTGMVYQLLPIAPSNLRGTVIGLHATLVGLALLPASVLAGLLWDLAGASAPFYFGASMGY